jgi:hypothetical protein
MPGLQLFKKGFYSHIGATQPIVAGTINLGATKGRGSSTRMFNYCNQRSANPSECINQFINVAPTPDTTILVYNTSQGSSFVWSGVTFTLDTSLPQFSYTSTTTSIPVIQLPQARTNLTGVTIGDSVTSIGNQAFLGCSNLTSVTFTPTSTLTSIGDDAFYDCGFTSIIIPNSVTSIGDGAFFSCLSLTTVTIGNSVGSIGEEVFRSCADLTSITIPASVNTIGTDAFKNSGLTTVTIATNPSQAISGITFTAGTTVTFFGKNGVNIVYP